MQRFISQPILRRFALSALTLFTLGGLTACESMPREQYIQWVARDTWNKGCAEKTMVETWVATNKRWKIKGEVLLVDVDATFKLVDDCGLKKAYSSERYKKQGLELSKCVVQEKKGWAIPGKEGKRCWAGPRLLR